MGAQKAQNVLSPPPVAAERFTDATAAVARLEEIYERNAAFLRESFESYLRGEPPAMRVRATYPSSASRRRLMPGLTLGFPTDLSQGRARMRRR